MFQVILHWNNSPYITVQSGLTQQALCCKSIQQQDICGIEFRRRNEQIPGVVKWSDILSLLMGGEIRMHQQHEAKPNTPINIMDLSFI